MLNIFQLAPNDQSIVFLGQIFGNVGVALSGTGPVLLGNMFKVFNTTLLVVGTLIVFYTTIVGVLTTAHEGEFLGKKMHGLWTPLRMVFGIALLMPTGSGYCAIQVAVMWMIVQGVGAADTVWGTVTTYFASGGQVGMAHPPSDPYNTAPKMAAQLFSNLVCQATVSKQYGKDGTQTRAHSQLIQDKTGATIGYWFGRNLSAGTWVAGAPTSAGVEYECGCVCWGSQCTTDAISPSGAGYSGGTGVSRCAGYKTATGTTVSDPKYSAQMTAMQSLVPTLEILADYYVQAVVADRTCWPQCSTPDCATGCSTSCLQAGKQSTANPPPPACQYFNRYYGKTSCPVLSDSKCLIQNAWSDSTHGLLQQAGSNFINDAATLIAGYALNYTNLALQNATPPDKPDYNNGWIYAGAYYYEYSKQSQGPTDDYMGFIQGFGINGVKTNMGAYNLSGGSDNHYDPSYFTSSANVPDTNQTLQDIFAAIYVSALNATYANLGNNAGQSTATQNAGPKSDLGGAAELMLNDWAQTITPPKDSTENPLTRLHDFGQRLLKGAEAVFWTTFGINIIAAGFSMPYEVFGTTWNPVVAGTLSYLISMFNSGMFFLVALFISLGGLFAVYIPLLPYMLFTFGVLGWFIAVIEAMVAAPIIAIGVLSPGGHHEVLGKAEPSIMILLNIFLRPTLMIFGMMAAMLLSTVIVYIINQAFSHVVGSILLGNASATDTSHNRNLEFSGIIEGALFIFAYASMIITVVNKCFSLIHIIPDRVLRFVGGHPESFGEEQMAQAVKGEIAGAGAQLGKAGAGVGGVGAAALKTRAKLSDKGKGPTDAG